MNPLDNCQEVSISWIQGTCQLPQTQDTLLPNNNQYRCKSILCFN